MSIRGISNIESYINLNDPPEVQALHFPPTEIDRLPSDQYVERDEMNINTLIYPNNVSRRQYQFDISNVCCHYNTLVCLPTGSGKTLIAAVVMMNFFRWYPNGKIIFMANTRALVNQQMSACIAHTNIPEDKIAPLMTGSNIFGKGRTEQWENKSVFFCTPQVVFNDIKKKRLDPSKVVLIIVDEAHHASGSYDYCNVVRSIAARTSQFRVIGLTATPGSDLLKIQSVIFNLMISKVIYLDDDDPEIAKYQHETDVSIITIPLGVDESTLSDYLGRCIQSIAEPLQHKGYLRMSNAKSLTKGSVFYQLNSFKQNPNKGKDFYICMDQFGILLSLASMQEKLTKYGASMLNQSLKDFEKNRRATENKKKLVESSQFQALLKLSERAKNTSHPKLAKLGLIIEDFLSKNCDSRVIVFTQLRSSAISIEEHLKKIPGVKCSIFIGQNTTKHNEGIDQSTQIEIINLFRKGNINCIIATSVGEEGLDIGEVDLIICFDTSSSPLKTVQRMGRTGRKRNGKVIFLMAEGYEEKNLEKAQSTHSYLKSLLNKAVDRFTLYNPKVPNLPLPENLLTVNVQIKRLQNNGDDDNDDIFSKKKKQKTRSPSLNKKQLFALQKCFGQKLKYKPLKIIRQPKASQEFLFSHSNESNLLMLIKPKTVIPEEIENEVLRLCRKDKNDNIDSSGNESTKKSKPMLQKSKLSNLSKNDDEPSIFDYSSDSDLEKDSLDENDDEDMSLPCIPLKTQLSIQDEYDEEEDAKESPKVQEKPPPKQQIQFLDDDDDDDWYFEQAALASQYTPSTIIKPVSNPPKPITTQLDPVIVKQVTRKEERNFLDDFPDDDFNDILC